MACLGTALHMILRLHHGFDIKTKYWWVVLVLKSCCWIRPEYAAYSRPEYGTVPGQEVSGCASLPQPTSTGLQLTFGWPVTVASGTGEQVG